MNGNLFSFIWNQKANRIILVTLLSVLTFALFLKVFVWQWLLLIPFIFFGVSIPIMLLCINALPYGYYLDWQRFIRENGEGFNVRKNVRVYIKNFWPDADSFNIKNLIRSSQVPYYDFERADVFESKDLIVIYGFRGLSFFGAIGGIKPFAISSNRNEKRSFYQVELTSIHYHQGFKEITFVDNHYGREPITIKMYETN